MTKKNYMLLAFVLLLVGCVTHSNNSDEDTSSTQLQTDTDDSDTLLSDTRGTDSETTIGPDTADGIGGPDEQCHEAASGIDVLQWCDFPELVKQRCDDNETKCCCRTRCQPSICDSDSELPCTVLTPDDAVGYCDLKADIAPVAYSCTESCTPRSQCLQIDTDGMCLDENAAEEGICLVAEIDNNPLYYCHPTCEIAQCDDTHLCSPLFVDTQYEGIGACVPINQSFD